MAGPEIHIGTSGWNYGHWVRLFYAEDLPRSQWLAYCQSKFDTLELKQELACRGRLARLEARTDDEPPRAKHARASGR